MQQIKKQYEIVEDNLMSLDTKLYGLHKTMMQMVIDFCKRNNVNVDVVNFYADCLQDAVKIGEWGASTDSSLAMYDEKKQMIIQSI